MPKITARGPTNAKAPKEPEVVEEVSPSPPPRPVNKASKPVWVAYAEALGVSSAGSKAAIIGRVG